MPKRIQMHFDVATDDQAAELSAAYEEIISGKRTRIITAADDALEIMERARTGLQRIVKAIEEHPGTGQARRLVRFLAGVYNGSDFPFDLTELRALDNDLANACIDYLNYDRLGKVDALVASQPTPDSDRPLVHARVLNEGAAEPLCGATDGRWSARGFDFLRLTCYECQSLVLNPKRDPT